MADNNPEIIVRPYQPGDEMKLAAVINRSKSENQISTAELETKIRRRLEHGGRAWIVSSGNVSAGYAYVAPISGLPGIAHLDCLVAGQYRNQGLGTELTQTLKEELRNNHIIQLSYAIDSLDAPEAVFLQKQGFFTEHVEWKMALKNLADLPPLNLLAPYSIRTFDEATAATLFNRLYEYSFAQLPWYQPYPSDQEMLRELDDPKNILFLFHQNEPIGFAWLRWNRPNSIEIEPMGIIGAFHGKGLGKTLLLRALQQCRQLGAEEVHLGVWKSNSIAVDLYEGVGFERQSQLIYLACDLKGEI